MAAAPLSVLKLFFLLFILLSSSRGGPPPPPPPPPPLTYLRLPVSVDSRQPLLDQDLFSPARGTGQEPLPEPVRELLLPARDPAGPRPGDLPEGQAVRTQCKADRMHVEVERSVLGAGEHEQLHLGTCPPSRTVGGLLLFEYRLRECGTQRTIIDNQVVYINTLQYKPPEHKGPIRRAVAFSLPVACYFNRYQYAYKVGYSPKMQLRKVFKQMKNGAKFILTPRNAQWERLSPSDQYVLGRPMYFEAEALPLSPDERLYVHSCYATPEKSHTSTPQFPVVKNFGCMVESKEGRSSFVLYKNNAVRFSVDAFLFKGAAGQLFMHCSMSVGSSVPTTTAKSCNYDTGKERWVELFGLDSVCECCDTSCSSAPSTETQIISSKSWTIESEEKPLEARAKPLEARAKPLEARAKPLEARPKPLEARPKPLEARPKPLEARPKPLEARPKPLEARPKPLEARPKPLEARPKPLEARPKPLEARPKPLEAEVKRVGHRVRGRKVSTTSTQPVTSAVEEEGRGDTVKEKEELKEPEWPFGGGGVMWVEEEEEEGEKKVKGSAAVEQITGPRKIFEEIFNFD